MVMLGAFAAPAPASLPSAVCIILCHACQAHAGDNAHVPYRESMLTKILRPSLGGNARTAIICMLTPAAEHADESANTLEFATRARKVVNEVLGLPSAALGTRSFSTLACSCSFICRRVAVQQSIVAS